MGVAARFEVPEINGLQPLTDKGVDFGAMGFKPFEKPSAKFENPNPGPTSPSVSTSIGGP